MPKSQWPPAHTGQRDDRRPSAAEIIDLDQYPEFVARELERGNGLPDFDRILLSSKDLAGASKLVMQQAVIEWHQLHGHRVVQLEADIERLEKRREGLTQRLSRAETMLAATDAYMSGKALFRREGDGDE